MRRLPLVVLAVLWGTSPALASTITIDALNNSTSATVSFDDGVHSGSISALLSQFTVTYTGLGGPATFYTFSVDLFHSVSSGQTYSVDARNDLASAFANGARIAFIYTQFGLQNLTSNSIQAAAVQISVWDLSLSNHTPTFFAMDADGSYSSGDENVFQVLFGANPDASQIATLVNQYLQLSVGAVTQGSWLDASPAGNDPARGQSLLQPVPEPLSSVLVMTGLLVMIAQRRYRAA